MSPASPVHATVMLGHAAVLLLARQLKCSSRLSYLLPPSISRGAGDPLSSTPKGRVQDGAAGIAATAALSSGPQSTFPPEKLTRSPCVQGEERAQ